ncbi:MAG: NUDIX hydrolase [Nocardioidaceae bacterium]
MTDPVTDGRGAGADPRAWRQLGGDEVLHAGFISLIARRYRLPDGREARWEMVDAPATATILPLTDDERVVCVRQFRPGPARRMLSLPGGLIDPGESVVDAARRELREETGYAATSLQEVAATQANSRTRPSHTLVALGCRPEHAQDLDDFEDIDVELVTLRDFRSLLRSGSLSTTEHAYLGLDFLGLL